MTVQPFHTGRRRCQGSIGSKSDLTPTGSVFPGRRRARPSLRKCRVNPVAPASESSADAQRGDSASLPVSSTALHVEHHHVHSAILLQRLL